MDFLNDNERTAAAWLRELIREKHLPDGVVDERSITDIKGEELHGCRQCHFFAGIGGWPLALQLAGWPATRPVWTGSCPCQPFSDAGKGLGEADARHLWPDLFRLIQECRPATVFGEQVASAGGYRWLSRVRSDLEAAGYAVGCADLPACSAGAPHKRNRLFWVADAGHGQQRRPCQRKTWRKSATDGNQATIQPSRRDATDPIQAVEHAQSRNGSVPVQQRQPRQKNTQLGRPSDSAAQELGHATSTGPQEQWSEYRPSGEGCSGLVGLAMQTGVPEWNGATVAVKCLDGARRVSAEPGAFPLASGLSGRMVRLRGYGNSIVPQVAATFIRAFLETESG